MAFMEQEQNISLWPGSSIPAGQRQSDPCPRESRVSCSPHGPGAVKCLGPSKA